ncbi:MAG: mucin7-like protein [Candidatus Saccharibacteria bacterium]|nr:mucin7-like protein [Candidatus Saccharibacteria bacterium]
MQKFKNTVRMFLIYVAVVLLAGGYPMAAMAETMDSTPSTSVAPTAPVPEPERTYKYNSDTERWDSDKWAYNPSTGKYEAVLVPLVTEAPASNNPVTSPSTSSDPTSTSTVGSDTNATIDNTLNSNATTGDSLVSSNTTGGNATTGNAAAVATFMNTVNSSVSGGGAEFATFVTDVVGDVHGDIMLYPMLLAAMLQAANHPSESTIAVNNDATIKNDINLNATSGNATVASNTTGGSAVTGSADTVANVMNIINSIIAANQSFVGTINIYGNLDGDILVAPDFLPQLLASNKGDSSTPTNSLAVSSQDTQSIINNIDLNAASGNALVASNTNAGSATTGDAKTNLVLLNLSGHQIVAKDSLLVFVNVLGQWVGLIVDAPTGTSAAALGTGVTTNTVAPELTIDVNNNSAIVNNITLNSQSGDATVEKNTNAGNATTGGATASANVANVSGSQLGLTGWFGVLFINVFGSWLGSFGVDTERGSQPVSVGGMGGVTPASQSAAPASNSPFQFVANTVRQSQQARHTPPSSDTSNVATVQSQTPAEEENEEVAGAATKSDTLPPSEGIPNSQSQAALQFDFLPFITAAFVIGLGILVAKNIIGFFRNHGAVSFSRH